ncbi:MAG: hypothetical protein WC312_02125 [Candidatus Omnitrophota bacterium]|jgi:hypothetical protein
MPDFRVKNNIVMSVCSLFVALLIIEIVIFNFSSLSKDEKKVWTTTSKGYGNCYSSDTKGYFPISLRISKDREVFRKILLSPTIEYLVDKTPYCIVYDGQKRREGFFADREREVAIVGDSFVFGEGVKEEDTLGYLLGLKFTKANFKNYGSTGLISSHSLRSP